MAPLASLLRVSFVLLSAASLAACGSDGLEPDDVTGLPTGDGRGTAASGTYSVRFDTTSCVGTCQSPVAICRDGDVGTGQLSAVQRDGAFTVQAVGGTLAGGIDQDGSFLVGAAIPFRGLSNAVRWDGQSNASSLTGSMAMHVTGTVDGVEVDCSTSADVTATRL